MLIIVEGCDSTGKTTLVENIAHRLKFKHQSFTVPKKPPFEDYMNFMCSIGDTNYVTDRFIVSEWVYQPIYRKDKEWLSDHHMRVLLRKARSLGVLLIHCKTDAQQAEARIREGGDWYIKAHDVPRIIKGYDNLLPRLGLPVIDYDFKKQDMHKFIDALTVPMVRWSAKVRDFLKLRTEGYGSLIPQELYIGEQVNINNNLGYVEPFIGGCGDYLTKLIRASYGEEIRHERKLHFTNAIKSDGRFISYRELDILKPTLVICLGNVAFNIVRSMQMPDKVAGMLRYQHPQFLKRFKHGFGIT